MKENLKLLSFVCGMALVSLVVSGCGGAPDAARVGSKHDAAFASATPEIKAVWSASMAAMKTNGYAAAIAGLSGLKSAAGLTPAQTEAIDQTVTAVSDQMYEAANKGDAAAAQAIQDLRGMMGR